MTDATTGSLQIGRYTRELNHHQAVAVVLAMIAVTTAYVLGAAWLLLTAYSALARWTQRREASRRAVSAQL